MVGSLARMRGCVRIVSGGEGEDREREEEKEDDGMREGEGMKV